MTTVEYTIPNISCGHCVHTIQMEVSDLAGVNTVQADQGTKHVVIHFEPPATETQIVSLLKEIDYPPAL